MKSISSAITVGALILCNAFVSLAQPMPDSAGALRLINDRMSGKNDLDVFEMTYGLREGRFGLDSTVTFTASDIQAGSPILVYRLRREDQIANDSTKKVSELIEPSGTYLVPIIVKGRMLNEFSIDFREGHWEWAGGGGGTVRWWQKVVDAWPETKGYHPKYIDVSVYNLLFHIPEIDDYNLTEITSIESVLKPAANSKKKGPGSVLSPASQTLSRIMDHRRRSR